MQKGRKIQREWSKVPGGNKKVPEVFSEGQPQGEVFESKDQFEEDKYSRSDRVYASQMGQFKASWFSRRSGLLKARDRSCRHCVSLLWGSPLCKIPFPSKRFLFNH